MGYELDRLMKQFGVSTASTPAYTGVTRPSPTLPAATGAAPAANPNYEAQLNQFNADMAKYNEYLDQYKNRIATGSMYNSPQYNMGLPGSYTGVSNFNTPLVNPVYSTAASNPATATSGYGNYNYLENNPTNSTTMTQLPDHTRFSPGARADLNGVTYVIGSDGNWQALGATPQNTTNTTNTTNATNANNYGYTYDANTGRVLYNGQPFDLTNFTGANYNFTNTSNPNTTNTTNNSNLTGGTQTYSDNSNLYDNNVYQEYSHGGPVKTHFLAGGLNDLASNYGVDYTSPMDIINVDVAGYGPRPKRGPIGSWIEEVATEVVPGVTVAGRARTPARNKEVGGVPDSYHLTDNARDIRPPKNMTQGELLSKLKSEFGSDFDVLPSKGRSVHIEPGPTLGKTINLGTTPAPSTGPAPASPTAVDTGTPAAPTRQQALLDMIDKLGVGQSSYGEDLRAAQTRANEETQAFADMISGALNSPEDQKLSKAELYFRLASAFGSPTKTGGFGENVSMAGKEMGEYAKGQQEAKRQQLGLRLKAQELKSAAAKEELGNLRSLATQEMQDKRALIKDFIESGKPMSEAGKQALDEGLEPGTPKYQARVSAIFQEKIDAQAKALGIQEGMYNIAKSREDREGKKGEKLTPQEMTLRRDTEDSLESINRAKSILKEAYSLNANSFGNSIADIAQRKALEIAGSKDPKLINTRRLEQLLKDAMLATSSERMKGVLSDSDIALLKEVSALDAKSPEERGYILRSIYQRLMEAEKSKKVRLDDIMSGSYRNITPE